MTQGYSVTTEKRGGVEIYSLKRGGESLAEIAPQWGNNCFLFHWRGAPILEAVPFETLAQKPTSYGIPILFPYPNRIRDGRFSFQGKSYTLDPPRHGFVRDKPWTVVGSGASDAEGAWLSCRFDARDYPEKILAQYPFPFVIEVTYRLKDNALVMETRASNKGSADIPTGLGTHAYFTRPAKGTVTVPARRIWKLADSLPPGERIDLDAAHDLRKPADVSKLELDDVYTEVDADKDGRARCHLVDQGKKLTTTVEFSPREFPEVVVYTAPLPRMAICIEPYTCTTDAFNLAGKGVDPGSITLPAGKSQSWTMWIRAAANG